jgi:putative glutathione S-transferase
MGPLRDGDWTSDVARDQYDHDSFETRVENSRDAGFPAEPARCDLYVSRACQWTHRAALTGSLPGLEDAASIDVRDPPSRPGLGARRRKSRPYSGFGVRARLPLRGVPGGRPALTRGGLTVPTLHDGGRETIGHERPTAIARTPAAEFDQYASGSPGLYPASRRTHIDVPPLRPPRARDVTGGP